MSIEIAHIGQQITAMDSRLEGSVNSSLRSTSAALQNTTQEPEPQDNSKALETAARFVEQLDSLSHMFDRTLQFRVSDELNRVVIKVVDSSTDRIIREIPSAEIQKLQLRIKEALGLLFDESI